MGSNARNADEVQSVITSLLVTYKNPYGIELVTLDNDYKNTEGERIPYRDLNYPSLVDYLKTIPSITVYQKNGSTYCLDFRGKELTRHVSKLVAQQKNSARPRGRSTTSRKNIPPNYHSRSVPRAQTTIRSAKFLSELIYSIQHYPKGQSKVQLFNAMRFKFPTITFSISDLDEELNYLTHSVLVRDNVVYPLKISSTPTEQRSTSVPPPRKEDSQSDKSNSNIESRPVAKKYTMTLDSDCDESFVDNDMDYYNGLPDAIDLKKFQAAEVFKTPKQSISNFIEASVPQVEKKEEPIARVKTTVKQIESPNNEEINKKSFNENDYIFSQNADAVAALLNSRVQFRLEKLIQNRPDGLWCLELPKTYKKEYNINLEWESLGFQKISDFASHLPKIFHVLGPYENGDFYLYDAKQPLPDERNKQVEKRAQPSLASLYNIYDDDNAPRAVPLRLVSGLD